MVEVRVARSVDVSPESSAEIRALLDDAFEGDFSDDDWQHTLGGRHVVVTDGAVLAHAAVVAHATSKSTDGRGGPATSKASPPHRSDRAKDSVPW